MAFFKNRAGQKIPVFAVDSTGSPKTGDAANISAQISLDCAATAATDDAAPSELDATDAPGVYYFNMLTAETNADLIILFAKSSTSGVVLRPVFIYTEGAEVLFGSVNDVAPAVGDFDLSTEFAATADLYNGMVMVFISGALVGQNRKISDYSVGRNAVFSGAAGEVDAPWPAAPANADKIMLIGRIG
jgi:hypothetical protein